MLNEDDLARMRSTLKSVRDDKLITVIPIRNGVALTMISGRITSLLSTSNPTSVNYATEAESIHYLFTEIDANIAIGDRFNYNGISFAVMSIVPDISTQKVCVLKSGA